MRIIDADALRDKLQREIDKVNPPFDGVLGSIRCGVRLARNMVEDEPTIDAQPVRLGRWVPVEDGMGVHFVCPYCGEWEYHQRQKYCGECGAKLEEAERETC